MNFENHQMDPSLLPEIGKINFHKIQKNFLYVMLLGALIAPLFLTVVYTILGHFIDEEMPHWAGHVFKGLIALFTILGIVASIMAFKKMAYAIRERDVIFRKGWIWQSTSIVPFNRVQHCEVNQNPIERIFGLSRIKIFTAGGSSSDLTIPGLLPERAAQIKSFIINKTAQDEEE